jgi:GTPase SAR1 family protein
LPREIGRLSKLTVLDLSFNHLTKLPFEVLQLTNLTELHLEYNLLSDLPLEIGNLTNLTKLDLGHNKLRALPPEIGHLSSLCSLDLRGNQLTTLPVELGNLGEDVVLYLSDNPWVTPFDELIEGSQAELFAYLRSLQAGVPQYEAKVLLVGEGEVGKSSLLAALRSEEFVKGRLTTHGIEIKQVATKHPDTAIQENLTLNFWDFGGQEVYRITHQFFFSPNALYLLVWKPREGQEENAPEGWLERIRLRVGEAARVLIVATHCNERHPELDYPALQSKYGDILAGHWQVDSEDGTGISELQERIAETVATLEHVGTPFNRSWLDARDEVKVLDQTHISYGDYSAICAKHGLSDVDAKALIGILNTLGHIVYYDAEGLRDFVVLKPEWLTKAIGYILEDSVTRDAKGILDHHRLRDIWQDHGDDQKEQYSPEYYPYFLRLMELYDVSYRLPDQPHASLIPQMVPYERPHLPWEADDPMRQGQLSLVCEMEQNPPGLIAWTTARNHRWSTDIHWRNGVFLRHEDGHEALLDFVSRRRNRLALTVRGEYPAHFLHLLQDGLELLIRERWPHLKYALFVPCPTRENGEACHGQFPLDTLWKARAKGRRDYPCPKCVEDISIGRLLEGYVTPDEPLREQLAEIITRLEEAKADRQRILAQSAEMTRRVLRALLDEALNGPRLFTLSPIDPTRRFDPRNWAQDELRLTLWCEHPGHEHELEGAEGRYIIRTPREWVTRIAPYALLTLKVLRVAAPIASGAIGLAEKSLQEQHKGTFDFMDKLTRAASEGKAGLEEATSRVDHLDHAISRAEGKGLRAFHDLLKEVGWKPGAANLQRVSDKSTGDVLWVCPTHYREYDPGLPVLPKQI